MHDKALVSPPDCLGNHRLEERADDQLRIIGPYSCLHCGGGINDRDLHLMPLLAQGNPGALTQPVVRRDQEQNPQRRAALARSGREDQRQRVRHVSACEGAFTHGLLTNEVGGD